MKQEIQQSLSRSRAGGVLGRGRGGVGGVGGEPPWRDGGHHESPCSEENKQNISGLPTDLFLLEGETTRLLVCRGAEVGFYENGQAGEKDVTDSHQASFMKKWWGRYRAVCDVFDGDFGCTRKNFCIAQVQN